MERGRLAQLATLYLLIVCAIGVLHPIRNALALNGLGAQGFYKVYLASAGVVVFLVPFGRLAARISPRWLTAVLAFWFVSNLVLFRALFPGGAVYGITFYAWHDLYSAVLVSQFFLVTQTLFDSRRAKMAYPVIIAGGAIGASLGGVITGFLVAALGVPNLLLVAAGLTAAFGVGLPLVARAEPHTTPAPPAGVQRRSAEPPVRWIDVLANRQLQLIAASVVLSVLVKQLIDYEFNAASANTLQDAKAVSAFQGKFNAATQWLPLVVTAALQPLLARWGVGAALLMVPAAMLVTSAAAAVWGGLPAAATAKAANGTMKNSAERTGREIVYIPVPDAIRARGKALIDVGVDSVAKALAAGAIFVVLAVAGAGGLGALAWTAAGLSLVWLAVAWVLRRGYVRALARAIAARDTTLDTLAASLRGDSREPKVLELLARGGDHRAPVDAARIADLVAVLRDTTATVSSRRAAARALGRMQDTRALNALLACAGAPPERDPRVRHGALIALTRLHRLDPALPVKEEVVQAALDHDLQAAARYRSAASALEPTSLLRQAVEAAWWGRRENVFHCLALMYPAAVMEGSYRALVSSAPRRRDAARELLDEGLPRALVNRLAPVLDEAFGEAPSAAVAALARDADPWVRRCATARTQMHRTEGGNDVMDDLEKVFLLQRVDVFREVRSDHLALLAGVAQEVDAVAGAVLMREEDIPDALYVVARGEVTLRFAADRTMTVKDGGSFGALGLIGERPAMLTATVPGPASVHLLRITRPALADVLVDSPELAVALLRGMVHRVDTLLAQLPVHSPLAMV